MPRSFKIVGAHFRPPAKVILHNLPIGTELFLIPEPTNEFDPNAIAVHWDPNSLPEEYREDMDNALINAASSMEDLLLQETIHLGYIPKVEAANIQLAEPVTGSLKAEGKDFLIETDL